MKLQLTNKVLTTPPPVPPGKAKLVVHDAKLPGFVAEIRSTGIVTFYCKYKNRAGQTRMIKVGRLGQDVTLDQARKKTLELRGRIAAGEDPAMDRDQARQALTVAEFAERFLDHQRARKKGWDKDKALLDHRILPAIGRKLLAEVTTAEITRIHDGIIKEGLTPATANRHLAVLKTMFNKAVLWGEIERSPALGVKLLKENNQRHVYLDQEQIQRLVRILGEDKDIIGARLLMILLLTGARFGEAARARWDEMDLEKRLWRLPDPKGGRVAFKHLSGAAVNLLTSMPREEGNPHVFPNGRLGGHRQTVQRLWERVCRKSGLTGVRIHDLRHTYASLLINSGESLFVVQQLLNHSTPVMTQRYAHLAGNTLARASEAAGRLVTGDPVEAGGP
ncbi:MAG: tyrosine-type recombinase/integrase [Alphaproteobacteria bacterium]